MSKLLLGDEVYKVVGAAFEVYNTLGYGFLEGVYQAALEVELERRRIPFAAGVAIAVHYKDEKLRKTYVPDLLCFGKLVIELKSISALSPADDAQLLNYLRATGFRVGLLLNFGQPGRLQWRRRIV